MRELKRVYQELKARRAEPLERLAAKAGGRALREEARHCAEAA
jgi:hypothetical protein